MLSFLPESPFVVSQPILFGALLGAGLLAGEAARRYFALPRIVGYVVAGIVLGPQISGLVGAETLNAARVFIDLAIGLIVFELGSRLDLGWLKRNPWLLVAALAESLLSFVAIYAALRFFDFKPLLAAGAAAVGTATSPAVVMLVSQELRAEGQITERMLLLTAVNCVFAHLALALLLPFLHLAHAAGWQEALLHPIYLLGGSALAGSLAGLLMLRLARWLGKREERQFILLVATIVLTVGVVRMLDLSVMLALVAIGIVARNLDTRHALLPLSLGYGGQLFVVVLFVFTGASLEFGALASAAVGVAAFVVARFLAKGLALLVFGRPSGLRPGGAGLLALALLPMSGLAVTMVQDTALLYPGFGKELAAVVLSAIALLELIGPLATQYALRRAGETHPEARDG